MVRPSVTSWSSWPRGLWGCRAPVRAAHCGDATRERPLLTKPVRPGGGLCSCSREPRVAGCRVGHKGTFRAPGPGWGGVRPGCGFRDLCRTQGGEMLPGRAKGKRGQGCFHQGNQRAPKVQLKDSHEVPGRHRRQLRGPPHGPHTPSQGAMGRRRPKAPSPRGQARVSLPKGSSQVTSHCEVTLGSTAIRPRTG